MSKVVNMTGNPIATAGDPDKELMEVAEEIFQLAQAGQISGLVTVLMFADGSASFRVVGATDTYSCLGAMEQMKYMQLRANATAMEGAE